MREALKRRVAELEKRHQPPPPDPHLFFQVVDASGDPESDAGDEAAPLECPVFGYEGRPIGGGSAPVAIMRADGESVEALQARCGELRPHLWTPITEEFA